MFPVPQGRISQAFARVFNATAFLLPLVLFVAGCGGGSKSSETTVGPAAKVIISQSTLSLDLGQVFTGLGALVTDANDKTVCVTGGTTLCPVTFAASPAGVIDIANNGWICAGTWDSKTTPVVCNKNTNPGTATITATYNSITSATPLAVSTHVRIASITLSTATPGCASSGTTQQFTAKAFDANGVDVTASAGAFSWSIGDTTIGTVDTAGLVTAKSPGNASLVASNNGVNSLPITFQTCPPASISLILAGSAPAQTSTTLASGGTATLVAVATDTKGVSIPSANIALTLSVSSPRVATEASTTGVVTAVAPGKTIIVASCTPPSCNLGVGQPIYSNPFDVTVTGTSSTTVYATGTDATTIVPIDSTTNTAGTAITIPTITPTGGTATQPTLNSMEVSPSGDRILIGTNLGLLVLSTSSNAFGTPLLPGTPVRVLAISPNGTRAILKDETPGATRVWIMDTATNATQLLNVTGAGRAAWTPDVVKAFIPASNSLFVYSPVLVSTSVTMATTPNDVAVPPQGTLAYVSGTNALQVLAVCTNNTVATIPLSGTPQLVEPSLDGTRLFAVDSTSIHRINISIPSQPCPPTTFTNAVTSFNLGGPFTPNQLIVLPDASKAYVSTNLPGLRTLDANAGTTSTIALTGGGAATTGGFTLDGANVFVGATVSNDVQKISTATNTVTATIAVNLKKTDNTSAVPNLVVVKP